jgi:hypothetical protein
VIVLIPASSEKLGESWMMPGSLIWRLLIITMLELFPASETPLGLTLDRVLTSNSS